MDMIANWLGNTPDFAVPFALAALGLILTERAGVLALGAEGLMLVGALAAIGAQLAYGSHGVSLLLAMGAAAVVSLLFALMVLVLRINQVIAGLALVFHWRTGRAPSNAERWRFTLLYGGVLALLYLGLLGMMVMQDTPSPMGLFLFSLHYLCYPVLAWLAFSPRPGRRD